MDCGRGYQRSFQRDGLGNGRTRRWYLGTWRRCERWHKHVCGHRKHVTNQGDPWRGGEAIVRFQAGPVFDSLWAPVNWRDLDIGDTDLGGCSGTLIDVPGANPSQLVLALGKHRNAYLLRSKQPGRCRSGGSYDERFQCHTSRYVVCGIQDW